MKWGKSTHKRRSESVRNPGFKHLKTFILYGILYTLKINEILILSYLVEILTLCKLGIYLALFYNLSFVAMTSK